MSTQEALKLLSDATSMLEAKRGVHLQILQALEVISKALQPKKEE